MRGAALFFLVATACTRPTDRVAPTLDASPPPDTPSSAPAEAGLTPLGGDWVESLTLEGGGTALVTPPLGARSPRPIIVAIHGAGSNPGVICGTWRLIADVYPFVVCPRGGVAGADRSWASPDEVDRRSIQAIAAVRARYGDHVDPDTPVIYAAFSQGAYLAGRVLRDHPEIFSRAVLTEGGQSVFEEHALVRAWSTDAHRVLLTCSQPGCAAHLEPSKRALTNAGVEVAIDFPGPWGHSMPPAVREAIHARLPWLVQGLEGWKGYETAPRLASH